MANSKRCGVECEVYSRIVGYYRPIRNWNKGKAEEFKQRTEYDTTKALTNSFPASKAKSETELNCDLNCATCDDKECEKAEPQEG